MKTLAERFDDYSGAIHPAAPGAARGDIRMAFYCGALTMFNLVTDAIRIDDNTESWAAYNALADELRAFRADLERRTDRRPGPSEN
jgi:hypothetical protein